MIKAILGLAALCIASMGSANAQGVINPVTSFTSAVNPTSVLQMTSATTAYTANQLIASSATAGSIVVPSLSMNGLTGIISRLRLTNNDTTSTAWGTQTITVDLWSAAPTFTNGDRGTYSPATGTAGHLASFTCATSAEYGDGVYSECAPVVGNFALPLLGSSTIYWTLTATTGSGITGASKKFTLTAEIAN